MPARKNRSSSKGDESRQKLSMKAETMLQKKSKKSPVNADVQVSGSSSRKSRSSSRSETPSSMYDFMGDSPQVESSGTFTKKSQKANKPVCKKVSKSRENKNKVVKDSKSMKDACPTSEVTPKTRKTKVLCPVNENKQENSKDTKAKHRVKTRTSIPQPNLDDISPIVNIKSNSKKKKSKTTSGQKGTKEQSSVTSCERRGLRSAQKTKSPLETPTVSFIEPNYEQDKNDSAIFVSPRKTMPRFSTGKTSTPANIPIKSKKGKPVKSSVLKLSAKDTSTPNEVRPNKAFTSIKTNVAYISPVQRIDTPTSDYGSMESFVSPPSVPKQKHEGKKRGYSPTPAFNLDDDNEPALSLNKSVDKSYKRSKKKYETGKYSVAKIEAWAEKVNSEMEDIENFELSIEG